MQEKKLAICSIKIYNYTARARAYTIIAKWPEGKIPLSRIHEGQKTIGLKMARCDKSRKDGYRNHFQLETDREIGKAEVFFRGSGEIGCER